MEASQTIDIERERSVGEILRGALGMYRRSTMKDGCRRLVAAGSSRTLAILYFDLRAREAGPARSSTPEYEHLRDLD